MENFCEKIDEITLTKKLITSDTITINKLIIKKETYNAFISGNGSIIDGNATHNPYPVSQPYPALLFVSSAFSDITRTKPLDTAIYNINTTLMGTGVIYTVPEFVKTTNQAE